jgi:hypothetical protein
MDNRAWRSRAHLIATRRRGTAALFLPSSCGPACHTGSSTTTRADHTLGIANQPPISRVHNLRGRQPTLPAQLASAAPQRAPRALRAHPPAPGSRARNFSITSPRISSATS